MTNTPLFVPLILVCVHVVLDVPRRDHAPIKPEDVHQYATVDLQQPM
jgi:hypothetical protein